MLKYVFREYNSKYQEYFQKEKQRLFSLLGTDLSIEHVGSTSVHGLGGKGFIDIVIAVPQKNLLPDMITKMTNLGFHYEPEASTEERFYFDREFVDDDGFESMYHYHLTRYGSEDWTALIAFRNFLRKYDWARAEYAETKKQAAVSAGQKRVKYAEVKNPVISKLLKLALAESFEKHSA